MDRPDSSMPEHLRLAGNWLDQAIDTAQTQQLSAAYSELSPLTDQLSSAQHQADTCFHHQSTATLKTINEQQELRRQMELATRQLDSLGAVLGQVEQRVGEMERAMGKAEDSLGLSLGGRLEQLTRFFAPTGTGVPYLRQWAKSRDEAVPKPLPIQEMLKPPQ